jgi:hypothetical protein
MLEIKIANSSTSPEKCLVSRALDSGDNSYKYLDTVLFIEFHSIISDGFERDPHHNCFQHETCLLRWLMAYSGNSRSVLVRLVTMVLVPANFLELREGKKQRKMSLMRV